MTYPRIKVSAKFKKIMAGKEVTMDHVEAYRGMMKRSPAEEIAAHNAAIEAKRAAKKAAKGGAA